MKNNSEYVSRDEKKREREIKNFINSTNVAILPLLFVFGAVVAYKVVTIL